jgi:NADP-dependent aldehyde dehydrogenase
MLVIVESLEHALEVVKSLEGNLTGSIYSSTDARDDEAYESIAPLLRQKVGRLLNDKMPTGVAVTAAMNHGGPFPATGHPGFTAVGFPASILRFSMLQCFDNVREYRLPEILRDKNPTGTMREIDGMLTNRDV